jgi:hypothetical protein
MSFGAGVRRIDQVAPFQLSTNGSVTTGQPPSAGHASTVVDDPTATHAFADEHAIAFSPLPSE